MRKCEVYITKYALTTGIFLAEVEINDYGTAILGKNSWCPQYFHGEGREWHRSKEAAFKKAEEMRARKLKSLDRQIKKISALEFKVEEFKY